VRVITHPVACAPCFYRACPIEHPCLREITAIDVAAALTGLESIRRVSRSATASPGGASAEPSPSMVENRAGGPFRGPGGIDTRG
jgi:hypothetical protein